MPLQAPNEDLHGQGKVQADRLSQGLVPLLPATDCTLEQVFTCSNAEKAGC